MTELLHNLALLITIWQMPLLFPDNAVKMQKVPLGAAIEKKRREIYYEKEVIDYETLGSICNDLGYDFSNSKIKVVKDFEPFQDTIDDLGICTFNQNKEKKIKTIFWAMNTLYKY